MADGWKPTTPRQIAGDALARCMEPEAWAEYDAGNGVCSNQSGFKCLDSIAHATRLMERWPEIVPIVANSSGNNSA